MRCTRRPASASTCSRRRVDGPAVLERVRAERDRFVSFVIADCDALLERGELLMGDARLISGDTLQVDEHTQVKFRGLVIATGSGAGDPPGLSEAAARAAVDQRERVRAARPAVERARGSAPGRSGSSSGRRCTRLGVRVTVVGSRGAVGPLRDPQVKAAAKAALQAEFELHTDHVLVDIQAGGDGVVMRYQGDGPRRAHRHVVAGAVGGRPAASAARASGSRTRGVQLDEHGRPLGLDEHTLRIGATPVFLAGDVSGPAAAAGTRRRTRGTSPARTRRPCPTRSPAASAARG